jgi:hypothetical protein
MIALKRRRRVGVGPVITVVFENRETVRFQIQEMVRAERIATDAGVQQELDAYNPLIPEPGTLSATLFIELTSEAELREWLPKLAGVERSLQVVVGDETVAGALDPAHAAQLTREDATASVHYLNWSFTPDQIERFGAAPVALAVDHPAYPFRTVLSDETRAELMVDLREGG